MLKAVRKFAGAVLMLPLTALAGTLSMTLVLADQSLPPYVMGEGPALAARPGLAVELAQQAASVCHVQLKFERLPGLRLLQNLQNGSASGALLLSYSKERAQFSAYPLHDDKPDSAARMTTMRYVFFVRRDSTLTWDGERLSQADAVVGTNLGWSANEELAKRGIKVDAGLNVASNLHKLEAGRIDAYVIQSLIADSYLARQAPQAVRMLPVPLISKDYFMPFNQRFAEQNPQAVQCMWQQVAASRDRLLKTRLPAYQDD